MTMASHSIKLLGTSGTLVCFSESALSSTVGKKKYQSRALWIVAIKGLISKVGFVRITGFSRASAAFQDHLEVVKVSIISVTTGITYLHILCLSFAALPCKLPRQRLLRSVVLARWLQWTLIIWNSHVEVAYSHMCELFSCHWPH